MATTDEALRDRDGGDRATAGAPRDRDGGASSASTDAPPRGQQGRAYRREELEGRVRDALQALMADGTPYRDLTVERITSTAGVARSTFYGAFADKAGLITALSAASLGRLYAGARSWIRRGGDVTRDDVAAGLREVLAAFREDEAVMRAVVEVAASEPAVRDAYAGAVDDYARAIARMIRRGVREGRLRDVPAAETATVLAWSTEATIRRAAADPDPRRAARTLDALADVTWRALVEG
ncbi:MAG: TetR/AcrR family transcriptional regulator [Solirubrobacteraceae bacterium]|nr:TetR/AcrR family transcriptional regulator [Solirubrobacteraceae bacterium]